MVRILSLDAERDVLELLHLIFTSAGYEHLYTTSNEKALHLLRTQPVDLFTQNMLRPKMNGCQFYELLHKDNALKHIPVLIISRLSPTMLRHTCTYLIEHLPPTHFVPLPCSPQVLKAAVAAALPPPTPSPPRRAATRFPAPDLTPPPPTLCPHRTH